MQLFVRVITLNAGTSEPSAAGQLIECPADVQPDTILSFLAQRFGDVVDTVWTTTVRHARLACGWVFAGPAEQAGHEVLCIPFVATDDGSLRSMFELQADQRAEFDELAHSGEFHDYTVIELPHRSYQRKSDDNIGGKSSSWTVSTGGGHRHNAGRAGTTEFPASWSDDKVIGHILSVARQPDAPPVRQPNQRWRTRGVRDGVDIIVLIERDGSVITAWPLPGGRGVQRNPSWSVNSDEALFAQTMDLLPDRFSARLDTEEVDALRMMAEAGEWVEEADLLVATLASKQRAVTDRERMDLTDLLGQLELATDQLELVPSAGS